MRLSGIQKVIPMRAISDGMFRTGLSTVGSMLLCALVPACAPYGQPSRSESHPSPSQSQGAAPALVTADEPRLLDRLRSIRVPIANCQNTDFVSATEYLNRLILSNWPDPDPPTIKVDLSGPHVDMTDCPDSLRPAMNRFVDQYKELYRTKKLQSSPVTLVRTNASLLDLIVTVKCYNDGLSMLLKDDSIVFGVGIPLSCKAYAIEPDYYAQWKEGIPNNHVGACVGSHLWVAPDTPCIRILDNTNVLFIIGLESEHRHLVENCWTDFITPTSERK